MRNDNKILSALQNFLSDRDHAGGISVELVDLAESELGVRLPRSYRIFLEHFGAAFLSSPYEVYGLPPTRASDEEPPLFCHILDVAKYQSPDIESSYVPISHDGMEIAIYLNTAKMDADEECPVIALGPGVHYIEIAPNFLAFVEAASVGDPLGDL